MLLCNAGYRSNVLVIMAGVFLASVNQTSWVDQHTDK